MSRAGYIRTAEIVTVLPSTVCFVPLAAFTAVGILLAMAQDAHFGLHAEILLFGMMMSMLGGIVGLVAVWVTMLAPPGMLAKMSVARVAIVASLGTGLTDACYWLWRIGHQHGTSWSIWCLWMLLLVGPIIVGVRHMVRLIRP